MKIPVRLYASFATQDVWGGNIAGVVYDDVGLSVEAMQRIASDLAAPTTGFVQVKDSSSVEARFFSSRGEMAMCGHVTIAIFASLIDDGRLEAGRAYTQLTLAGDIGIETREENGRLIVAMNQLIPRFGLIDSKTQEIAALLSLKESDIRSLGSASTALRHLFVELTDAPSLARIHPNDNGLRAYSHERGIDTIGVWSLGASEHGALRPQLRDLCHGVGDPEEAASGTTNGALACWLWEKGDGQPDARGILRVDADQGIEMGRPSRIEARLRIADSAVVSVQVGGAAKRRLDGLLSL